MENFREKIEILYNNQIKEWDLAKENFNKLDFCEYKELSGNTFSYTLQINPERIKSTLSKIDKKSLAERPCFLCRKNRPVQQKFITYQSPNNKYEILVNPFPICKKHFTIVESKHTRQTIKNREEDLLDITDLFEDYVIFFNGAKCGASAPDHMHFQSGNKNILPIIKNFSTIESNSKKIGNVKVDSKLSNKHIKFENNNIYRINNMPFTGFYVKSREKQATLKDLSLLIQKIGDDSQINILSWKKNKEYVVVVFPRKKHRPSVYYTKGPTNRLISPASLEMGGLIITPLEKDFKNTTYTDLKNIFTEICYSKEQIDLIVQKIKAHE